jgi:rubrerythrin
MTAFLRPVHHLVWRHADRRARLLLRFAEVEADGGRDLVRAAELTSDAKLRLLFLRHALDEQRHADLFRQRGLEILRTRPPGADSTTAEWIAPGERGLDDVRVEQESEPALLAFLHLSERDAARQFTDYAGVLAADPATQAVFQKVVRDEAFHMTYTHQQLMRLAPQDHRRVLWRARLRRAWRLYLRLAGGLAALFGAVVLTLIYYLLLPPFAFAAKRAAGRELPGWRQPPAGPGGRLDREY